ncbi:MAG TPA: LytTR family DNA-binding domain-containing protein [Mucilaginibacter sp.]|nr:LytTR family DNA-binding domain-containing protein [Mucilaginibacter sp.]
MISSIAIDDEPKALEVIERYCQKTDLVELKTTFREPVKAIEYLNRENVDLVFLDINMPDVNGIQLLQTLPVKPMVIFTTAYSNYAVESYNLNAIDYLLKPITFERFLAAVNKVIGLKALKNSTSAKEDDSASIFVKSGPQTYQVKLNDIWYLEKDGNYLTICLKDKNILVRENMGDIFDLVPEADFIRVHKSYVVAIKHISMIEAHQLTIGSVKIPVGSTYRENLKGRLGIK